VSNLPVLIPMPDAPKLLGLSRSALYRTAGEGRLKIVKLGKSSFIDRDSALAFIASLSTATIRRAPDRRRVPA
jgi:predicted DNA-binding transcriptional regulator AlpA